MGDDDKTETALASRVLRPWEQTTEIKVTGKNGRVSILDGVKGLRDSLSEGTKTDILGLERQCQDWETDWGLVSSIYTLVCRDLAAQNRDILHDRDTKSLPKGFSYEVVAGYYRPSPSP
ncbi:Uncharacterised protein [uncultured archaeon]|nr:Uncharacterised protein [uncultured archaeon]